MDDPLGVLGQALREFTARVDAIGESQWDAATPDAEWCVRDLVEHVVDEHRWVPPLMHGHDLQTAEQIVRGSQSTRDVAGGAGLDLASEWHDVAVASEQAFGEPDALSRTVSLSRGPTPAADYLNEMIFDLVVHGWDLGRAIGYSGSLPESIVEPAYAIAQQFGDMSFTGMFAPPVAVADDAPTIDKLVAATGRDPK
jgi:uncharacterized protein (TIGR03086 family)